VGNSESLRDVIAKAADVAASNGKPNWRDKLNVTPVPAMDLKPFIGKPIPYIVKPLIIRGSLTQIQGTQKGGKSAFANYIALCASSGKWPLKHLKAEAPMRVVYISWEDVKHMMAQKLALYGAGMNFETQDDCLPANLTYFFRPSISIEQLDHLDAMKEMVRELEPDIIIFDTLAHSHGCDENAASQMRLPMANLAALAEDCNIGVVYLHHIAKLSGDRSPQDKSRGSSAIAAAWHVMVDWGVREEGSNINPVQIQSKFLHKFLRWEIEYSHDGNEEEEKDPTWVRWGIEDMAPTITISKRKENKLDQVWGVAQSLVSSHPTGISKQNLRVALDCSENTAGSYLDALCTQGRMMRSNSKPGGGRGNKVTYKLPPKGDMSGNLQDLNLGV
jgi:hypothetical protein